MSLNTIEYAKIFQAELDKQLVEGATSGWMEENARQVIYNGGNEIKMPKMSLQGLGDYDRDSGYVDGAITYSFQTMKLTKDRGRRFRLDAIDVDESGFALAAANVASEFQRTKVIPEVDAYRYSTLAELAEVKKEYSPAVGSVLSALMSDIGEISDVTGGEDGLVVTIARPVYDLLMSSSQIVKHLDISQFKQGEIDFSVKTINGVPVIPVSSARMKSKYTYLSDGMGGFSPTEDAVSINWIICPKSAPIAVSKTDNIKIISPEINQFADAWDIDYRKYHDLFLPEQRRSAVAVSLMK
ncbi:MAG: hypothetical protein GX346_07030 [Clostridiales bacterium]|nr:hypothetical protein [Clostridiales bacterium]